MSENFIYSYETTKIVFKSCDIYVLNKDILLCDLYIYYYYIYILKNIILVYIQWMRGKTLGQL